MAGVKENRFIIESSPEECLWCLYGEIPYDTQIPFPLCSKHIDIARFILDKADIPNWIETNMEAKRGEIQNKLKQYCKESECGARVVGCSSDVDCTPKACWYHESVELLSIIQDEE